jgi:hypothetical protein
MSLQAQLIDWAQHNIVWEAKKKVTKREAASKAETRTTWRHEAKVLIVKAVEECGGITTAILELKNIRMKENSANVFATIGTQVAAGAKLWVRMKASHSRREGEKLRRNLKRRFSLR